MASLERIRKAHMNQRIFLSLFAVALAAATFADAAFAEMFRCVSPSGSVSFTDNEAACPGAEKHEASGRLQTVSGKSSDPEPASPAAPLSTQRLDRQQAESEQRAQRELWQSKKRTAEEDLRRLEARQARLARVITGCNRGSEILTRDSTGIKYQVPCDEVRQQHEENAEQAAELREYLANGLRRECRESGCLPGWIR